MRITILSGSARENNNSIRVSKALTRMLEKQHAVKLIDFRGYDIPMIAQGGLDKTNLSPFQMNLLDGLSDAHVVFVISPEYNWSTTPELLNMYDLLGNREFSHIFNNKVFAFAGVSTGKGGKTPCLHLIQITHKIISFTQNHAIVSPKIFESHFTKEMLDEGGFSKGDETYMNHLQDYADYTLAIAEKWFR